MHRILRYATDLFAHTRKVPAWAYLLVLFVLLINAFYIYGRLHSPIDGLGSKGVGSHCVITAVVKDSPGARSGLLVGDTVLAIGNHPVPGSNHFYLIEEYKPGDQVIYLLKRKEETIRTTVTLDSMWSQHAWFYFLLYIVIFVVSITSLFIIYKKPTDRSARIFFLYLQLFAIAQNTRFLFIDSPLASVANIAFILSFNIFGVTLLNFHLIFPRISRLYPKFKPVLNGLYGIGLMTGIILSFMILRRNLTGNEEYNALFGLVSRWSIAWMGLVLCLAFAAAFYQYASFKDPLARKQLRLVIIGSFFGLLTPILFSINPQVIWRLEQEKHLLAILEFTNATGAFIMISFLITAIFKYRLWEIEIFIRKALLYTAATAVVLLAYMGLLSLVDLLAIKLTPGIHFIILGCSTFIFLLLRDLLQNLIERLFQREKYDSAMVVTNFEESLAGLYDQDELNAAICKCLDDIFHVGFIVLARKTSGLSYEIIYKTGKKEIISRKDFYVDAATEALLSRNQIISSEEIPANPGDFNFRKGELVVPFHAQNQFSGFFLLGGKLSEKSYNLQDVRILSLLSRRILAMYHTAELYKKDLERHLLLERERTRIAEDMHDEVGASLTRIAILSEMARKGMDRSREVETWLGQISDISRRVMQEMNQIIWALNPKNDSLSGLLVYLRRFAFDFFEPTGIRCSFDLPADIPRIELGVEKRRSIYMVVREALHNVVKHSGAKEVRIILDIQQNGFLLRIKDDGKGFTPEQIELPGNGLINMKKRMFSIGGEFTIHSTPGNGTEIELGIKTGLKEM